MSSSKPMVGSLGAGIKCPSANVLKTNSTNGPISSNGKSTKMTQSSSNKQFQTKDTPEGSQRQKVRVNGTTTSSNSKVAGATMSSCNSNPTANFNPTARGPQ